MKRVNELQLWGVQVRRVSTCTVYVQHHDPVEARQIGAAKADDFETAEQVAAYPLAAPPDDRYWTADGWVYPETARFDGAR